MRVACSCSMEALPSNPTTGRLTFVGQTNSQGRVIRRFYPMPLQGPEEGRQGHAFAFQDESKVGMVQSR